MGKQWKQWKQKKWQALFLGGPQITADGDCSHEIKRRLLLGRKAMTNLGSILTSRDITLPIKVCLVKAMIFLWSKLWFSHVWMWELCCRKGDPFQGPKLGSCLIFGNELSKETHVLTKQEILLGKGTWVESSRVREARRTALPVACSLGFYGDGISFRVVFGQSF